MTQRTLGHTTRSIFILLISIWAMMSAADAVSPATAIGSMVVPYHGAFAELPLGTIRPQGWIAKFVERESRGLAGHPENMAYPYDTCMLNGAPPDPSVAHGAPWWRYEQSGYFFDGLTRLSHVISSPALSAQRNAMLQYLLSHSDGSHLGASQNGWPNAVIGRGLWAEFSATNDQRYAALLQHYVTGNAEHLLDDRDGINAEIAMLLYGQTGDARLLTYAHAVYQGFFANSGSWCSKEHIRDAAVPFHQHGVTAAETLKILPIMYLYDGNEEALDLAKIAYTKVLADSGMPDGGMVSDESLGSVQFRSLHETCDIVDWSWSLGYLLMATGDVRWADAIERTAYNALPGVLSKDFTQVQYFSAVNQLLATSTSSHGPYSIARMSYRAAHDTECCAGNVTRAMPNHIARMWMRVPADGGIAAIFYGPSDLHTTIASHVVDIHETTEYPFKDRITFTIHTDKNREFPLHLRIPGWCTAATLQVNGVRAAEITTAPGSFVRLVRSFADGDIVTLTLPMAVHTVPWFGGRAVSIERGPLVFSLQIDEHYEDIAHDSDEVRQQLQGNNIQGFHALDIVPTGEWRYGIRTNTSVAKLGIHVIESTMTDNPFLPGTVPVRLEVQLLPLPLWLPTWDARGQHQQTPPDLPDAAALAKPGLSTLKTLVPLGATYLRLTTVPVVAAP